MAMRSLRLAPAYSLLNIAGLSLGMTGTVLIFLFLQYHLRTDRHQPYFDRTYRVVLDLLLDEGTEYGTGSSVPLAIALAGDYAPVEKVGFIRKNPHTTLSATADTGVKRFIEKDNVVFADPGFMQLFAFRWLGPDASERLSEPYSVVVSEKIARKYFGTAAVIGKILTFSNSHDLKIVGVVEDQSAPTDFNFDVYISLPTLKKVEPGYELDNFAWLSSRNMTFVRLPAGTSPADIESLIRENGPKYYGEVSGYYRHQLQPLGEVHFDERYDGRIRKPVLTVLAGIGIFLLLIACINFVNLATARALKRTKEIGVRKVLGGTRRELFRQFLTETALLAFISAVFALVLAMSFLPVLNAWMHTGAFHIATLFQLRLAAFWSGVIVVVILMAGFYPAVVISGFNPVDALKQQLRRRATGGLSLRRSLVAVQLIIAQILIIGTIVLVKQLHFFKTADLGFDQSAVITIQLPTMNPRPELRQALRNDLLQFPEVGRVTFQYEPPASGKGYGGSVRYANRIEWEKFVIRDRFGDENYLAVYQMPLLAGRNISGRDSVAEFVVNEELMHKLGIRDPQELLGQQLEDGNTSTSGEIVGVVKSFHHKSLHDAMEPCAIFAHPQLYRQLAIKLHSKELTRSIANIQSVWQEFYPDEVFSYQFVDEQIALFYEKEEQLTSLTGVFAVLAIFICCLGLYGMVSFMVSQSTREIGIRKVLGAGVKSIVLLFGKDFLVLAAVAFLVAAPIAWYTMSGWLNDFAYRIDLQWWIVGSGGILMLLIVLLTVGYKVIGAARMNPVRSLKME